MNTTSSFTKDLLRKYKGLTLDEAYISMLVYAGATTGEAKAVVLQSEMAANAPVNMDLVKQVVKDLKQPHSDAKKEISRLERIKRQQANELKNKKPKLMSREALIAQLQNVAETTDGKDKAGVLMKLAQMLGYDDAPKLESPQDRVMFYLPKREDPC